MLKYKTIIYLIYSYDHFPAFSYFSSRALQLARFFFGSHVLCLLVYPFHLTLNQCCIVSGSILESTICSTSHSLRPLWASWVASSPLSVFFLRNVVAVVAGRPRFRTAPFSSTFCWGRSLRFVEEDGFCAKGLGSGSGRAASRSLDEDLGLAGTDDNFFVSFCCINPSSSSFRTLWLSMTEEGARALTEL